MEELPKFNGIGYVEQGEGDSSYRNKVAEALCELVQPDVREYLQKLRRPVHPVEMGAAWWACMVRAESAKQPSVRNYSMS